MAGLFDFSAETEFIGKEIVKCINMAKDGIHAVLVVLSVRTRFSKEEAAAVNSLRTLFGNKITDYMIIVFTGGDELEFNEKTLEDYLGRDCPEPLRVFSAAYQCFCMSSRLLVYDTLRTCIICCILTIMALILFCALLFCILFSINDI